MNIINGPITIKAPQTILDPSAAEARAVSQQVMQACATYGALEHMEREYGSESRADALRDLTIAHAKFLKDWGTADQVDRLIASFPLGVPGTIDEDGGFESALPPRLELTDEHLEHGVVSSAALLANAGLRAPFVDLSAVDSGDYNRIHHVMADGTVCSSRERRMFAAAA